MPCRAVPGEDRGRFKADPGVAAGDHGRASGLVRHVLGRAVLRAGAEEPVARADAVAEREEPGPAFFAFLADVQTLMAACMTRGQGSALDPIIAVVTDGLRAQPNPETLRDAAIGATLLM